MKTRPGKRISALLESIIADFPRRKKAAEALMRQHGIKKPMQIEIAAPEPVVQIPTFHPEVAYRLTHMLKERFDFAGTWKMGQEVWLSAGEMARHMKLESVQVFHRSRRENWEGSAPANYSDDRLTLFGITESVPEDAIYLVWATEGEEPEVWVYEGFDSHKFKTLEQYFKWCLERE